MKKKLMMCLGTFFIVLALAALPRSAWSAEGQGDQAQTIQKSITVLEDMTGGKGIPPQVLQNAKGIAIIPGVTQVALGIGGKHGSGVAVEKVNGRWSPPVFVNISGGSLGAQIGATSTDVVLVFQNRDSFQKMLNSNFKLGANASVQAGSSVRGYTASTQSADVLAYKKSEGAFAGINLSGSTVNVDNGANQSFYNEQNLTPQQIVSGRNIKEPPAAKDLNQTLKKVVSSAE